MGWVTNRSSWEMATTHFRFNSLRCLITQKTASKRRFYLIYPRVWAKTTVLLCLTSYPSRTTRPRAGKGHLEDPILVYSFSERTKGQWRLDHFSGATRSRYAASTCFLKHKALEMARISGGAPVNQHRFHERPCSSAWKQKQLLQPILLPLELPLTTQGALHFRYLPLKINSAFLFPKQCHWWCKLHLPHYSLPRRKAHSSPTHFTGVFFTLAPARGLTVTPLHFHTNVWWNQSGTRGRGGRGTSICPCYSDM